MHEVLAERAGELARLATTIRSGIEQAEAMIPALNQQLAELDLLGVTRHQVEGPGLYGRPAGLSNDLDDSAIVFQAVLLMPGGIGVAEWTSDDYSEHQHCSHGEPVDLRDRFVPYGKLPLIVRALLVPHASQLIGNLLRDVRILNG
jgi:hypothetical protein